MAKFINPFTDWGFKRLFGQEFSKDLLMSFLNDLFEGELHVKEVAFKDKEQLADTRDMRGCVYDVYCTTDDGKHFIVEMQNRWTTNFVNRTICYASKAITDQREKERTKVKPSLYELVPVCVISFMNFSPHEGEEITNFKTDVMLREKNSEHAFTDKLRFIYLSLPLFTKGVDDCNTDFERWIYVLKHMTTLDRIPFETQKKIFKRLSDLADSRCLSKEEMEKYEESQNMVDNYNLGMASAWMEGNEKGIAQGRFEEKTENARKMIKGGLSDAQVMQFSGLTQEQLNQLKK